MRLGIFCLPGLLLGLALAGCDRQKAADPQGEAPGAGNAAANAGANAAAPAEAAPTGRLDRSHQGTRAPDIVFEDGEGRPTRLSAFRGRPVLVNLWATWCGPCVVEMPSLDALAAREEGNVAVIAISQDMNGRQAVTDFFRARGFRTLQPYLDGENRLMTALGIETLPTTILYNGEGEEVWRMTGRSEWQGERAARLILEADAG